MQEHVLVTLSTSRGFHIAGTAAFDLYAALGFLLDMLYIGTAMPHNLGTEVEPRH